MASSNLAIEKTKSTGGETSGTGSVITNNALGPIAGWTATITVGTSQ